MKAPRTRIVLENSQNGHLNFESLKWPKVGCIGKNKYVLIIAHRSSVEDAFIYGLFGPIPLKAFLNVQAMKFAPRNQNARLHVPFWR